MQCEWENEHDGDIDDTADEDGLADEGTITGTAQRVLLAPYRLAQSLNFALVDLEILPPPPEEIDDAVDTTEVEQKPLETMEDIWKSLRAEGHRIKGRSHGTLPMTRVVGSGLWAVDDAHTDDDHKYQSQNLGHIRGDDEASETFGGAVVFSSMDLCEFLYAGETRI